MEETTINLPAVKLETLALVELELAVPTSANQDVSAPIGQQLIGQRGTRQRSAIRAVIDASSRPLLPQEILEKAQSAVDGLGMATIYRNVKLLAEAGEIRVVELPGESPRYESAHHGHHHHFQCRACTRVFDIHACPGDFGSLAPNGFRVESHELTLYGLCASCTQGPRKAAAKRRTTK